VLIPQKKYDISGRQLTGNYQQLDESKALPDMTLGGWQRAIA
jgi:hypothetical protein